MAMHRIKINFTARDKLGRQPVGLRDARNIYIHIWGLGQMEFSGHRRALGHRPAGGRFAAPYTR